MSTYESHADRALMTEDDLRRAIAERDARLAEIADVVARVRHEINNPLTGVIGQTQLLLRSDLDDAARRRVQTIDQLATRIRDIVARLRDVQRPHQVNEHDGSEDDKV